MRRILIVGAGQSGLQLGLSLLAEGYEVSIVSARTPEEIRTGWPTSTQAMFDDALQTERAYGLNLWEAESPDIAGLHVNLSAPPGTRALGFKAPLDKPAQSTDQRVKMAAWLELFEERGGILHYQGVTTADLDGFASLHRYDLIIVAAGKGDLVGAFDRDPVRSVFTTPQRGLAIVYVNGMQPDPLWPEPNVSFNAVPGLGELIAIPCLTLSGPCDILFWEAVPGGPLDLWPDSSARMDPSEHLKRTLELAREYTPWVYERCHDVELADARATLHGRYTPTVREPVAHLPGGGVVFGMADVVVANDPITGQGSNNAAKCAAAYLKAILARGDQPFDEAWMRSTFEDFWTSTAQPMTDWTNAMLQPLPPHVQQILGAASVNEAVARRFANGFCDPSDFQQWLMRPDLADAYLASV
jgi:Styrene monooxygenase A putative substrate binding domain